MGERLFEANGLDHGDDFPCKAASTLQRETNLRTIKPPKPTRIHHIDTGCAWFGRNPPINGGDDTITANDHSSLRNINAPAPVTIKPDHLRGDEATHRPRSPQRRRGENLLEPPVRGEPSGSHITTNSDASLPHITHRGADGGYTSHGIKQGQGTLRIDAVIDISDEKSQLHGQDTLYHKGKGHSLVTPGSSPTTALTKGLDFDKAERGAENGNCTSGGKISNNNETLQKNSETNKQLWIAVGIIQNNNQSDPEKCNLMSYTCWKSKTKWQISQALDQLTLSRRGFYPERDVIKWN